MTTLLSFAQKSVITQLGGHASGVEPDLSFCPLATMDLVPGKDLGKGPTK